MKKGNNATTKNTSSMARQGGQTSLDKSAMVHNQRMTREGKAKAKFIVCINAINGEHAKRGMASYLNSTLDLDYLSVRNDLLGRIPATLPGEFRYEEAKRIRENLEELGSSVLIIEKKGDSPILTNYYATNNRRNLAVILGIILILSLSTILIRSVHRNDNVEAKPKLNTAEAPVIEPSIEKTNKGASLRLASEAVRVLRTLALRYQTGISYSDYLEELRNAKPRVSLFLESQEAKNRFLLAHSIRNVMVHYENAARAWSGTTKYTEGYAPKTDESIRLFLELYPEANQPREIGGACGSLTTRDDIIWLDSLVSIVIDEASKELKNTSRLLQITSQSS
jgi:hypothetical protein